MNSFTNHIWRQEDDDYIDGRGGNDKLYGAEFTAGAGLDLEGEGPRLHFDTETSRLWFDADGSGGEASMALVATLNGVTMLTTDDLIMFG